MINYMKSEFYRLLHKNGLHLTGIICFALITAAAFVLYYFQQHDLGFPYATSTFLYSNVISSGILIIIISFLYNASLTGKDLSIIKQSVSFGISRSTIFWSKLILTLSYFLLICLIGLLLTISLAESLLVSEPDAIKNFLIASMNMIPIVLSGFFIIHTLKMLIVSDILIMILLFFLYLFSGDLLRTLLRQFTGLNELYKYAPDVLLDKNFMSFFNDTAQFGFDYWVTGIFISVIALLFGSIKFANQHID